MIVFTYMLTILIIVLLFTSLKEKLTKAIHAFEKFELHHKILTFIGTILLTILVVRIGVNIYNPNPLIFGFELHHFDYGIVMLLVLTVLLLFDKNRKRYPLYLALSAISLGLIIDELWYVRVQDTYSDAHVLQMYNKTSNSVIILFTLIVLSTIVVSHTKRKNRV